MTERTNKIEFFKGFRAYFSKKEKEKFEEVCRKDEAINRLPPHEYIAYFAGVNSRHILGELRAIKWLLVIIIVILVTFANHTLPNGWWYNPW